LARVTGSTHLSGWQRGIRAFDLAPGVVRTDMTEAMRVHRGRTDWTSPAEVTALVLAMADGTLDAWSGRLVRAGVDTVASLSRRAAAGLGERDRTVGLLPWGSDDPLG
jgi:NAD(P)-dependent dehydrogenase (short-subunit alcohol dehydrogenase family)